MAELKETQLNTFAEQPDKPESLVSDETIKEKLSRINFDTLRDRLPSDSVFLSRTDALETIASLVVKLESFLPKFDVLLSDDASGHLLTLLLRKLINKLRIPQGKEAVETYFLAASCDEKEERTRQRLDFLKTKISPENNVLVITEYIQSGETIMKIIKVLRTLTERFRIATISTSVPSSQYKRHSNGNLNKFGSFLDKTFWGRADCLVGCALYKKHEFSGVYKDSSSASVHPSVYRGEPNKIKSARKDIDILAEEFIKLLG